MTDAEEKDVENLLEYTHEVRGAQRGGGNLARGCLMGTENIFENDMKNIFYIQKVFFHAVSAI